MAAAIKLWSNLAPFSRLRDRFVPEGYGPGWDFEEQVGLLARVEGISGVGLDWPTQFQDGAALRRLLESFGLQVGTVEPDIYTGARFRNGSLSNPDPGIRQAAVDIVKGAIDAGLEAGAPDMNLWLGHDGFDYPFGAHHGDAWEWLMESLHEIAEHDDSLPIGLEYKCKEPRVNQYVSNAGRALLIVNQLNRPHVGITLDVGHALAGLECPAECAVLALREGRLQQVHLNDNYRDWDHDMVPGAVNCWDLVEFFFWVRKLGYDGWYGIDVFPYRADGAEALRLTVQAVQTAWEAAEALDAAGAEELLRQGRNLEVMGLLWGMVRPSPPSASHGSPSS